VRGRWSAPEVASFSGQYPDAMPFVSPDGAQLYFASRRPAEGGDALRRDFDLWVVDRVGTGWGAPRHLQVSTPGNDVSPAVSRDGTLYFVTGALPRVVRARRNPEGWDPPSAVADAADAEGVELAAYVDPDERFMVVSVIGRGDALRSVEGLYARADLYVRERRGDAWSPLRRLPPPINSAADELAPAVTPDGRTLLFTSERGLFTEHGARVDYRRLERGLREAGNGLGDLFQVPARAAGLP
jgi:Tol biopolymer transport system component